MAHGVGAAVRRSAPEQIRRKVLVSEAAVEFAEVVTGAVVVVVARGGGNV